MQPVRVTKTLMRKYARKHVSKYVHTRAHIKRA